MWSQECKGGIVPSVQEWLWCVLWHGVMVVVHVLTRCQTDSQTLCTWVPMEWSEAMSQDMIYRDNREESNRGRLLGKHLQYCVHMHSSAYDSSARELNTSGKVWYTSDSTCQIIPQYTACQLCGCSEGQEHSYSLYMCVVIILQEIHLPLHVTWRSSWPEQYVCGTHTHHLLLCIPTGHIHMYMHVSINAVTVAHVEYCGQSANWSRIRVFLAD